MTTEYRHPHHRKELLELLKEDQREVRACSRAYRHSRNDTDAQHIRQQFVRHSHDRVERGLAILNEIGVPTVANIGADGAQALSVLALHAKMDAMRRILQAFEECYRADPKSVYNEAIPSLTDRFRILDGKRQIFGTQWMLGEDGKFFLPPVEDFKRMNDHRAVYGLGRSQHPIDLTDGVPDRPPLRPYTEESDQRYPTEQEYREFAHGSLE